MSGITDTDYHKKKQYYKNYYLLNKETIKSQIRANYNNNKERINIKVECECGRVIINRMMKKHLETNIHKKCLLLLLNKHNDTATNGKKTFSIKRNIVSDKIIKEHDGWIYFK